MWQKRLAKALGGLLFGVFFAAYAFTRAQHVALFNTYQATLDQAEANLDQTRDRLGDLDAQVSAAEAAVMPGTME